MMPRSVLVTTATLTLVAGVLGFLLGQRWQALDETQVISRVAAEHMRQTGDAAETCFAVPGQGAIWLRVMCNGTRYDLDRRGVIVQIQRPGT